MGDFFTTPNPNTEIPVPPGQDQFDVPPVDYKQIGKLLEQGKQEAGGVLSILKDIGNLVIKAVTVAVGTLLSLLLCAVGFLLNLINRIDDSALPGFNSIARNSLAHVFGVELAGATPRKAGAGIDTAGAAENIGKEVMKAVIGAIGQTPGTPLRPTSAPAEAFISKVTHIGIEGWVEGMLPEIISLGHIEGVMQLAPIMAEILGLGRMSRRVMAPPLKILVTDPYLALLHDTYRPTLLSHDQAVRELLRGKMTRAEVDVQLGRQGYKPSFIDALINLNSKQLSLGDVDYLVARGHWSVDQGVQTLRDDGYSETTARQLLQLAQQRRIDVHNQVLLDTQIAAFERGEIDGAALNAAIAGSTMPDGEKAVLEAVSQMRRTLNVKHLSLGEVQTMVKQHIMSLDDVRRWMTRENYPEEEQGFLELLILGEITSADDAKQKKADQAKAAAAAKAAKLKAQQDKAAAAAAALETKGVSLQAFEQLVMDGQRTFDEYKKFLQQKGMTAASITDLVDLLHARIDAKSKAAAAAQAVRDRAAVKKLPLATIEKGVQVGTLTISDLQRFMHGNGFTDDEIKTVVDLNQAQLAAGASKAKAKADAAAKAQSKDIPLPQLERAARLGITTPAAYAAALTEAGLDADSRDVMVALLNEQISADDAARQKRADAAAKAAQKEISLPALEQAIIAGVRPIGDYQAQLSELGYDSTDQASMVALLELRIDHAKAVAAKHATAGAKLATKNLSISELDRAVKLGVMSVDAYKSELAAVGFQADDIDVLATSLLAELAIAKQAEQKRNAAAVKLAKKSISLAQQETLVRQGVASIGSYTSLLLSNGYTSADAQQLTDLLSLRVEQDQAAAAKRAIADQRAADKDISLAKEEQAVIDGARTMDDYAALLADLGFDELDQATLEDLLASKVSAARAKAAAAAAAPPPGPAPSTGRRKKKATGTLPPTP